MYQNLNQQMLYLLLQKIFNTTEDALACLPLLLDVVSSQIVQYKQ